PNILYPLGLFGPTVVVGVSPTPRITAYDSSSEMELDCGLRSSHPGFCGAVVNRLINRTAVQHHEVATEPDQGQKTAGRNQREQKKRSILNEISSGSLEHLQTPALGIVYTQTHKSLAKRGL